MPSYYEHTTQRTMAHHRAPAEAAATMTDSPMIFPSQELSETSATTLWAFVVIGAITFAASLFMGFAQRAWQIYYVTLFLDGNRSGRRRLSAAYRMTNGTWGEPFAAPVKEW